jgi:hypothetical protein
VALSDDTLVVAQVASSLLPELAPGAAVRVVLRLVPVVVTARQGERDGTAPRPRTGEAVAD